MDYGTSRRVTTFSDISSVYVTPSTTGIGRSLNLKTIDKRLESVPLRASLRFLARLGGEAQAAVAHPEGQCRLARRYLETADAQRFEAIQTQKPGPSQPAVFSPQVVLNLVLRCLVHCSDGTADLTQHQARALVESCLALGDYAGAGGDGDEWLALELVRLGFFYRIQDRHWWFDVAHRLLFEVLPTMESHPKFVDVRHLLEAGTGLGLETFWSLTLAHAAVAASNGGRFDLPQSVRSRVTAAELESWANVFTIQLPNARRQAAKDILQTTMWSFGAVFDRPLLQLAPGERLAVNPQFVAMKATPHGLYDLIQRYVRNTTGDTEGISTFWGAAVEKLARLLIDEHLPHAPRLVDETDIRRQWGGGKTAPTCDTVFLGDAWVAVDFVKRRLTTATVATGNLDHLAKDLQWAVVDKFKQVDATLERGLKLRGPPPGGCYPIVVVGAPFPMNGLIAEQIEIRVREQGLTTISGPSCKPPRVLDLCEFWLLLALAEEGKLELSELLDAWLSSALGTSSFRDWVATDGPGPPAHDTSRRYQEFIGRALLPDGFP
jgi:hypothetical protein